MSLAPPNMPARMAGDDSCALHPGRQHVCTGPTLPTSRAVLFAKLHEHWPLLVFSVPHENPQPAVFLHTLVKFLTPAPATMAHSLYVLGDLSQ